MTVSAPIAPPVNRIYSDSRILLRALLLGPLPYSTLVKQCGTLPDRAINTIDHALAQGWIERRVRRFAGGVQASDFVITALGKRIT